MASHFQIHKPYVVASLPVSLNPAGARYAVGQVWGRSGSKKLRRQELVVGIDGESADIYNVSSSRLITSYPIPPQSSFTCPPYSLRYRSPTNKDVTRHTYLSTYDHSIKITLFKDTVTSTGSAASTTLSTSLSRADRVVLLSTTSPAGPFKNGSEGHELDTNLIVVNHDGGISCLDGESLEERWHVSADSISQDLMTRGSLRVDFAEMGTASNVIEGIFSGKDEVFSSLPSKIQVDSYNPDVLVLITTSDGEQGQMQHLHVLVILPTARSEDPTHQRMIQVHIAPLPPREARTTPQYRLDLRSGALCELIDENLCSYKLSSGIPTLESQMFLPDATSFLQLSKTSVVVSTPTSFDVYNPVFQSLQASAPRGTRESRSSSVSGDLATVDCCFVTYFSRLEIAVALVGTKILAMQLEPPKNRVRSHKADGLLIDSLGRGVSHIGLKSPKPGVETTQLQENLTFSSYIVGSVSSEYWSQYNRDVETADALLAADDLVGYEFFLAGKFGILVEKRPAVANGIKQNGTEPGENTSDHQQTQLPDWLWPESRSKYAEVDRRWLIYAMSRAFNWNPEPEASAVAHRLDCRMPESNIINYLVDAGHLSTSNLRSALKSQFQNVDDPDFILGQELPTVLGDIDPTMELLLAWLNATKLGSVELITATRLLMRSLELLQDPTEPAKKLITFAPHDDMQLGGQDMGDGVELGMELDQLEQKLQVTEYYLGDEKGTRARGMSVAFVKLGSCPANSVTTNLRRLFRPEEILSLIYVLRLELVKDGWTTRYLDTARLDEEDLEAPPDGSIRLIADLLCRCIDSVGPGGWITLDAVLAAGNTEHLDSADFLAALKLEISAALEGVQEAVYLRGFLSEAVKYGTGIQNFMNRSVQSAADKAKEASRARPKILRPNTAAARMLPLGLKVPVGLGRHEDHTMTKVISGGEVVQRSKREHGNLTSKKVGPYTLERIDI